MSYSMMIPETLGNINLLMLRILNYVFLEIRKHWNFLSVWCHPMILMRRYLQLRNIFWMFILTVTLGCPDFYVSWIYIFCNVVSLNKYLIENTGIIFIQWNANKIYLLSPSSRIELPLTVLFMDFPGGISDK